jgi:hypothetical protein
MSNCHKPLVARLAECAETVSRLLRRPIRSISDEIRVANDEGPVHGRQSMRYQPLGRMSRRNLLAGCALAAALL